MPRAMRSAAEHRHAAAEQHPERARESCGGERRLDCADDRPLQSALHGIDAGSTPSPNHARARDDRFRAASSQPQPPPPRHDSAHANEQARGQRERAASFLKHRGEARHDEREQDRDPRRRCASHDRRIDERRSNLAAQIVRFVEVVGEARHRLIERTALLAGGGHRGNERAEDGAALTERVGERRSILHVGVARRTTRAAIAGCPACVAANASARSSGMPASSSVATVRAQAASACARRCSAARSRQARRLTGQCRRERAAGVAAPRARCTRVAPARRLRRAARRRPTRDTGIARPRSTSTAFTPDPRRSSRAGLPRRS